MMHHATDILLALFAVFVAAQIGAWLARLLRLPGVVGEIAAGCAIGPSALGWIAPEQIAAGMPLDVLAEIGVVLLLFSVGLETRLDELKKVGRSAFLVGLLGVIVPFALGSLWAHGSGFEWTKSMFVAAAFVATSAGITARVLQELGALPRIESRVILGAAVIDDILAMLLLGVVTSLQSGGGVQLGSLLFVLAQAIGFVAVFGLVGTRVMRGTARRFEPRADADAPLVIVRRNCCDGSTASRIHSVAHASRSRSMTGSPYRTGRPATRASAADGSGISAGSGFPVPTSRSTLSRAKPSWATVAGEATTVPPRPRLITSPACASWR